MRLKEEGELGRTYLNNTSCFSKPFVFSVGLIKTYTYFVEAIKAKIIFHLSSALASVLFDAESDLLTASDLLTE